MEIQFEDLDKSDFFIDCIYNECDSTYMFSYVSHKKGYI